MPRKKLNQLSQTHGQLETFQPTTIDQILGDRGGGNYKFLNDPFSQEEYAAYLKGLVESDLFTHCQDYGIICNDNRKAVEKKLLAIFAENRAKYRIPKTANPKASANTDHKIVSKIMAAGK
jgi:hypothetical protein